MCRMHHNQEKTHDYRDEGRPRRYYQRKLVEGQRAGDGDLRAREDCARVTVSVAIKASDWGGDRESRYLLLSSSRVALHVKFMMAASNPVWAPRPSFVRGGPPKLPYLQPRGSTQWESAVFSPNRSVSRASVLRLIRRLEERILVVNRFVSRRGSSMAARSCHAKTKEVKRRCESPGGQLK